ncbi:MAG: hypothetical protein KAT68_10970 [Bacteroidales bacterium]|nr:hypothetical protein [Bacteroidales bacterium]
MQKLIIILFFSIGIIISNTVKGANENYPVGAGHAGMANATVMVSDVWANYHNQAGLSNIDNTCIGFYFENRFNISELGLQSVVFALPTNSGVFGVSLSHFGYSVYSESKAGLAFGKSFGEQFSAGIQFDYFYLQQPEDYGNFGIFAVEMGIQAEPVENLLLGAHVFNITRAKISDFQDERMPTIMRIGMGYRFSENLLVTMETEKDLDEKARFKAGIEYLFRKNIFLRTGIATNPTQNYIGIGYTLNKIKADIAFSFDPILPMTTHVSLSYSFN